MVFGHATEKLIETSNRIGVDIDNTNYFNMLKTYYNAKYMFPDKEVRVYRSSSGNGFHIEVIGVPSTLVPRLTLGDCRNRVGYSVQRSLTSETAEEFAVGNPRLDDILFTTKTLYVHGRKYRRSRERIEHIGVDW